ncbi:hypothetical protein DL768_005858 [Monosporascus sp. mg162]|nr:hypothetical protein DL768_005858 [Monosporascus sp. mg162]
MAPRSGLGVVPTNYSPSLSSGSSASPRSVSGESEITAASTVPLTGHAAPPARIPSRLNEIALQSENPQDEGWPLLAKLMVKKPGFEAFSRFRELNVKNLLYYHVELDYLRERLEKQEHQDLVNSDRDSPSFAQEAVELIDSGSAQWQQILRLRKVMREYNKALLQYAQISALPEPTSNNMKQLVEWLRNPKCGNFCISGPGSQAWGDLYQKNKPPSFGQLLRKLLASLDPFGKLKEPRTREDLVVPRPHKTVDGLTRWIEDEVVPVWDALWPTKEETIEGKPATSKTEDSSTEKNKQEEEQDARIANVKCYPESTMLKITSGVATVIACLLSTLAIAVLTTAKTAWQRLLWIGGFTAMFSIGLMFLTSETPRVHIFSATAA